MQNGVGHQDISVVVLDDSVPELAESFELRLMDLYNEAVIQPSAVGPLHCKNVNNFLPLVPSCICAVYNASGVHILLHRHRIPVAYIYTVQICPS